MATLLDLATRLGPDVLGVAVAPAGLDVPFRCAELHDARDTRPYPPGLLLLGTGLIDVSTVLQRAGERPAALVVATATALPGEALAEAASAGVAVLTVPADTSWIRLAELVQALVDDGWPAGAGAGRGSSELVQELFDIAGAVASRVQAPITIEDTQSRLLAYSAQDDDVDAARAATILGHRVPDAYRSEVRRLGITKRLLHETDPVYLAPALPGISPRMVVALRARGQVLGSMWAVTDREFDGPRTAAFVDAARAVSLRIWQHRVAADLQHEQRVRTLALVLAGGPAAVEVGRRAGLEAGGFRLLAARAQGGPAQAQRLLDALSRQAAVARPAALTAELGGVVYAVLPCAASAPRSAAEARDVSARLRAALDDDLRDSVLVGRSGHCTSLSQLGQAHEDVRAVLRVLAAPGSGLLDADVEDVGLQVVLHRLAELQGGRPLLRHPALDEIAGHDARHATDYLPTLEAYLSAFGDAAAAAQRLNVHTNTFRYRLRRLGELFHLDLEDPELRFALMLQLRLDRS